MKNASSESELALLLAIRVKRDAHAQKSAANQQSCLAYHVSQSFFVMGPYEQWFNGYLVALTLSVHGSTLEVRIWRLKMSDSDV